MPPDDEEHAATPPTPSGQQQLLDKIRSLEEEVEQLRNVRVAATDRARATQTAVSNALNAAAERIERTTQVLNRTIGGGIAIG